MNLQLLLASPLHTTDINTLTSISHFTIKISMPLQVSYLDPVRLAFSHPSKEILYYKTTVKHLIRL